MKPIKAWAAVDGCKIREFDGLMVYRTREEAESYQRLGTRLVRVEIREVPKKRNINALHDRMAKKARRQR